MKHLKVPRGILRACVYHTAEDSGLPQEKATRSPRWQICPDSQPAACRVLASVKVLQRNRAEERDRCIIRDRLNSVALNLKVCSQRAGHPRELVVYGPV